MKEFKNSSNIKQKSGSPLSGEPEFLVVGRLRRPHGLHGELKMEVKTDFPERLSQGVYVYLGEEFEQLCINSIRSHGNLLLIKFDSIDDPETAGQYRNNLVFVRVDDRPKLPQDEYYHHQLLGLRVVNDEGQKLGILEGILETGANDVYLVRTNDGSEILLPAIKSVILDIDLERSVMLVHLISGLEKEK